METNDMNLEMEPEIVDDDMVEVELDAPESDTPESDTPDKPKGKPEHAGNYKIAMQKEREKRKKLEEQNARLQELVMQRLATEAKPVEQEPDPLDDVLSEVEQENPKLAKALKAIAAKVGKSKSDDIVSVQVDMLESKYPGISEHKPEISALVQRLGITPEEAFLMKHGHELLARSREDILREHEIKSAAHQNTPSVSATGNAQPEPVKRKETLKITRAESEYLKSVGITPSQYAAMLKKLDPKGGITMEDATAIFSSGGATKKG